MQGSSLFSQLSETHGVLVYHAAALTPAKLRTVFSAYGTPSVVHTYVLSDDNYATAVFFADASSGVHCYVSLCLLVQESEAFGIGSVGWIHEKDEETFAQRSYVKSINASPVEPCSASQPVAPIEGYLAVYWKGVAAEDRTAVTQMAGKAASEVFEDEKEGGRTFLRFPSEDMADAFHSHLSSHYPSMRRCLSYADAVDFTLAKKTA